MTIDDLKQLMAPPEEVVYPGSKPDWDAFQNKVGMHFPAEYYALVHTYGSGRFLAGEFKIANPFDPDDQKFAEVELTRLKEARARDAKEVPFPLFPESGGLYPFGIDDNGNTFLWLTFGSTHEWPIVCFNSEDYSEVVNHTLTEFMVLLATNRLKIKRKKFWGNNVSTDQLEFVPRKLSSRRKRPNRK